MVESLLLKTHSRKQEKAAFFRSFGERISRNPTSKCTLYSFLHFSFSLPIPTGSSPVTALPSSPGVVRLPSHRVMTCRLSDPARGETARFEPRNDRHRRPEEDEEKDSANKIRQKTEESEMARSKERPHLLRTLISRTSSPRQTGRRGRSFSEFSRFQAVWKSIQAKDPLYFTSNYLISSI